MYISNGSRTLVSNAVDVTVEEIPRGDQPLRFDKLLAKSEAMKDVLRKIVLASQTDIPVLVTGETGTGKDLVAQSIHSRSRRCRGPFVPVNVGAIAPALVASELFGHERGAFTGAQARRRGKFELADQGTLFLDEVSTMDARTQVALLRTLETQEFCRVGGEKPLQTRARIVAATNVNLASQVQEGTFREDLYFRLDVFSITLPPLRERPGAIRLLCEEFVHVFRTAYDLSIKGIADDTLQFLESYVWPGNIRELKNIIHRGVLLARRGLLLPEHLPERIRYADGIQDSFVYPLGRPLAEVAREYAQRTLLGTGGNKTQASRLLGVSRKSLYSMIRTQA